jgi:hypothetical protein
MHPKYVDKLQQKKLIFQTKFLTKVRHLKDQGKKCELSSKTSEWIDENSDMMFGKQLKSLNDLKRCTSKHDSPCKRA